MNKILGLLLLAGIFLTTSNAQINGLVTVITPNGGEQWPKNGSIPFQWTNSVQSQDTLYLDNCDSSGNVLGSVLFYSVPYYSRYNQYFLYQSQGLDPGYYKLRIISFTYSTLLGSDSSDGVFEILPNATVSCEMLGDTKWSPGEEKKIRIIWLNFGVGDKFSLYLFPAHDIKINGGFLLSSGTFLANSDTMTLTVKFPTREMSISQSQPSTLVEGQYYLAIWNQNNSIRMSSTNAVNILFKKR